MQHMNTAVGIIGGAGPTAGANLFQRIVTICQEKYRCEIDADFPRILLLSYPFQDILGEQMDKNTIEKQLLDCLNCLISNHVSLAVIACNTLHSFLPKKLERLQLVHMIEETMHFLRKRYWEKPLILCSSTAARARLHREYFPCSYPEQPVQRSIDDLILRVTKGCCLKTASTELRALISDEYPVVLGCTELSIIHEAEPIDHPMICNPNEIAAEVICDNVYKRFEG